VLAVEPSNDSQTSLRPYVESDEDLAARAATDAEALATLYRRHFERIARYVGRRVMTTHEAEDVTAQAFLAMVRGLPKWRRTGVPVLAWLYRLATNSIVTWSRRRRLRKFFGLVTEPLDERTAPRDDAEELRHALTQIPEPFQTALTLHYLEELPVETVAAVMNAAAGTIKSRLARGRELLRQRLEPR
jgi:RNA polymerase sigma-70 factor (ECF subfamily)